MNTRKDQYNRVIYTDQYGEYTKVTSESLEWYRSFQLRCSRIAQSIIAEQEVLETKRDKLYDRLDQYVGKWGKLGDGRDYRQIAPRTRSHIKNLTRRIETLEKRRESIVQIRSRVRIDFAAESVQLREEINSGWWKLYGKV